MTFHEYESEIRDTLVAYIRDGKPIKSYMQLVFGMSEEIGEVTSIIRKATPGNFHETEIDLNHLVEEIGDVIWYIAQTARRLPNTNLESIAQGNLEKTHRIYQKDSDESQLTIKKYQQGVMSTYREDLPNTEGERATFLLYGLITKFGEASGLFGRPVINKDSKLDMDRDINLEMNIDKIRERLGDCLWYLAAISENYGLDLEAILRENIRKAQTRYKNGVAQVPEQGEEK